MIQLEELHPTGYGMFVYSPDVFVDFLKAEKCRARKLLTYFDKHRDVFFRAIGGGVAMPFYRISTLRYPIFVSVDGDAETPEGWEQVYRRDGFFIKVGESGRLCFAAFDYLEYRKDLINKQQTEFYEIIPSGPEEVMLRYNSAVGFDIPAGYYNFDLFAYRRAVPLDESTPENYGRNYAFGFAFRRTDTADNDNLTKGDNEKTIFDIPWYIESTHEQSKD